MLLAATENGNLNTTLFFLLPARSFAAAYNGTAHWIGFSFSAKMVLWVENASSKTFCGEKILRKIAKKMNGCILSRYNRLFKRASSLIVVIAGQTSSSRSASSRRKETKLASLYCTRHYLFYGPRRTKMGTVIHLSVCSLFEQENGFLKNASLFLASRRRLFEPMKKKGFVAERSGTLSGNKYRSQW